MCKLSQGSGHSNRKLRLKNESSVSVKTSMLELLQESEQALVDRWVRGREGVKEEKMGED